MAEVVPAFIMGMCMLPLLNLGSDPLWGAFMTDTDSGMEGDEHCLPTR